MYIFNNLSFIRWILMLDSKRADSSKRIEMALFLSDVSLGLSISNSLVSTGGKKNGNLLLYVKNKQVMFR